MQNKTYSTSIFVLKGSDSCHLWLQVSLLSGDRTHIYTCNLCYYFSFSLFPQIVTLSLSLLLSLALTLDVNLKQRELARKRHTESETKINGVQFGG